MKGVAVKSSDSTARLLLAARAYKNMKNDGRIKEISGLIFSKYIAQFYSFVSTQII
jgi:hypothetical protein